MNEIITINIKAQVPNSDCYIERQTAFTMEQNRSDRNSRHSLADKEIDRMLDSLREDIAARNPNPNARVCSDGKVRVTRI